MRPLVWTTTDTYVVSCGDAAVWNEVQVQRFLLPDGVHHHQCLLRKIRSQVLLYPRVNHIHRQSKHQLIFVSMVRNNGEEENLPDLNDQHVLSEVVPLFEYYSNRCRWGGRWHGGELQPQWLLLRGHHLAFVQLYEWDTKITDVDM